MSHLFRPVLLAFIGIVCLVSMTHSLPGDDYVKRAATEYRDKNFESAYLSAEKSTDQVHRSFVQGMAAYRLEKFEEAAVLLADAEQKLPLIADYAQLFQAEAFLKLKKYPEAAAKAASVPASFPGSRLVRYSEKLYADILYESGDCKAALEAYQAFIEKYPSGGDSVDAGFSLARCREETGDAVMALLIYRNIWLDSPASPLAAKSQERLTQLELSGFKLPPCTSEELFKRATTLYAQNQFRGCLKTLEMIPAAPRSPLLAGKIDLRTGLALYRLRQYQPAEKELVKAAAANLPGVSSEARFWLAKSLERQGLDDRALTIYLKLGEEGKKQEFAANALREAAGLKRSSGQYAEAARLFNQVVQLTPESGNVSKALWDLGWTHYLAGEYPAAVNTFMGLLADENQREKVLYWLAKALEKSEDTTAGAYYRTLLEEYPAGFYATWYREQHGVKDTREQFGNRNAVALLPLASGFEKAKLLSSLGMFSEARSEMALARKKNNGKNEQFPAVARVYLEMQDYGSAISLFTQNRPVPWEAGTLPLWTAGYPRAYTELVSLNAGLNGLSEGLVYALIRAESGFAPAVKSGAGAIGLMQMMPATAKQTAREKGEFDPLRLTVPEYNVRLGTKHLGDLMKAYDGDVVYMAAAYNAGSGALKRWQTNFKGLQKDEFIESIPYLETRDYVKKVYASAATYRQLYGLK